MAVSKYKVGDIVKNKDTTYRYIYTVPEKCKIYKVIETRNLYEDIRVEPIEVCPGYNELLGKSWWVSSSEFVKCFKKDRGEISG